MKNKIAQLKYQSSHRGCKENDILLSKFDITSFTEEELDLYEKFLLENDVDIYKWLTNIDLSPKKYFYLIQKWSLNIRY